MRICRLVSLPFSSCNPYPNSYHARSTDTCGFNRYLFLSVVMESSEMTCPPVERLISDAESVVTKFEQGDRQLGD